MSDDLYILLTADLDGLFDTLMAGNIDTDRWALECEWLCASHSVTMDEYETKRDECSNRLEVWMKGQ